ncbi:MAG: ROK family transcriptional regulator [Woeseiaceae bacterium]|nr:ROK family transcriptional regulator [Woeseiaceae bacterium]
MSQSNAQTADRENGIGSDPVESKYFRREAFPANSDAERAILALVLRRGPLTQSQISQLIDRPQQTVSRLLSKLIERGSLRQGSRVSSGKRGQLSVNVEIVPDYAYALGIGIMWDAVSVTLMDFSGKILDHRLAAMTSMGHDRVVEKLRELINELEDRWSIDEQRVFGAGVGMPGPFMRETGTLNAPLSLDEWSNVNVEALLADDLEMPVWLENDGNAAAIGESLYGVGRWAHDFVYLYISTGLGGGVIHDGELIRGTFGNAGEVAKLLPPNMYPHPNLDLLRKLVSAQGVEVASVSDLVERFDPNWPGVEDWIVRVRDSLTLIASASAALLDPELIVLGGRIPTALAERVIPHIEIYDQRRRSHARPLPRIVAAEAGGDATATGAAALTFKRYFFG